jgi:hypothetical protein
MCDHEWWLGVARHGAHSNLVMYPPLDRYASEPSHRDESLTHRCLSPKKSSEIVSGDTVGTLPGRHHHPTHRST